MTTTHTGISELALAALQIIEQYRDQRTRLLDMLSDLILILEQIERFPGSLLIERRQQALDEQDTIAAFCSSSLFDWDENALSSALDDLRRSYEPFKKGA